MSRAGSIVVLFAALTMCASCGSHASPRASGAPPSSVVSTTTTPAPTATTAKTAPPTGSLVATARVPMLAVYDAPNGKTTVKLANPWKVDPDNAATAVPQVFLVSQTTSDGWVRVLLPVRPNGTTGWVHASDVNLSTDPFHITVRLGAHQIIVTNDNNTIYQGPVATGLPATPTPTGHYYLRVLIKAINPNTVYGPYAYGLSSHSNVYSTFEGGDAEIGIHGNNDASVLGHDASHGCIRMDNAEITKLATILPLGTPVDVER